MERTERTERREPFAAEAFHEQPGVGARGVLLDEVLHDVRTDGPPPIEVVVSLLFEVCDALARAHAHGVVHGALRPSQILVDEVGHARLLGLERGRNARALSSSGAAEDLFWWGVIAYELLTGRPLCDDTGDAEVRRYVGSRADPPSSTNRECSPALDRAVLLALAPCGDARPISAAEECVALASLGGARPAAVAAWLHPTSVESPRDMPLDARPTPPPLPGVGARGSGRLPSRPLDIHEAATVLRMPTPVEPEPCELRLPIVAPPEPYVVLDASDHTDVPIFEHGDALGDDELVLDGWTTTAMPPIAARRRWLSTWARISSRPVQLALAFVAGALAMYLLVAVVG